MDDYYVGLYLINSYILIVNSCLHINTISLGLYNTCYLYTYPLTLHIVYEGSTIDVNNVIYIIYCEEKIYALLTFFIS